ncbi:hypothetical protein [Methanobrevibacter sp.]|uniref:hypothetical protein n=1 Tax=Methanobrevibacter sp. TaxID=66852 RepID=UPI00386597D0
MNTHTKILIGVLAIFVVGMTLGVAFAEPVDAKTFKDKGYKWKIKNSKWKKMKKQAKKNYKEMRKLGSSMPGYSKGITVKVTKNGYRSYGTALAIQNDYYLRCEVRGATNNGAYLDCR